MLMLRTLTMLAIVAAAPLFAFGDQPPANAKPMHEIVSSLERAGYGPFSEVSFDDGHWEVEAFKNNAEYELRVDPASGRVLAEERDDDNDDRPTAEMKPLSAILQSLHAAGFHPIVEVDFDRRHWEVEAIQNNSKRELHVDPMTGKVTSNRADD